MVYIAQEALKTYYNDSFKEKDVIISETVQVAIYAAYKAQELGAKIIGMSSSIGAIFDQKGIDIALVQKLKEENQTIDNYLKTYKDAIFYNNNKELWKLKSDIVLPYATQNEIDELDIKHIINNKPLSNAAITALVSNKILFLPAKAANAGGVATSSFEMTQNATNSVWTFKEVDQKLKQTMETLFSNLYETANDIGELYNLEKAANITAFNKLYLAMKAQGI